MSTCNAKTRSGGKCKNAAMENGRCRMHGGKSTGPNPESMKGNQNAAKWGFWSKHVTPEQLAIMQEIDEAPPVDILWSNILVAYSAIIRAQKLMFVRDQEDIKKHLVRQKSGESFDEQQWEFQYPWDRHANFMQAQARAQGELRSLIKQFLDMSDEEDTRRLKLESMRKDIELKQAQIDKLRNPDGDEETADDGFMDALKGKANEVWDDAEDTDDPDQV